MMEDDGGGKKEDAKPRDGINPLLDDTNTCFLAIIT
jgi:hypothetical protein